MIRNLTRFPLAKYPKYCTNLRYFSQETAVTPQQQQAGGSNEVMQSYQDGELVRRSFMVLKKVII